MAWRLWEPWSVLSETASCLLFAVMSRPSWSESESVQDNCEAFICFVLLDIFYLRRRSSLF